MPGILRDTLSMKETEFLIIGGGPTGLGAACRLQASGRDWHLLEMEDHFGGLASSFVDDCGFTWDLGGHVHFSHYDSFDRCMNQAIPPDGWLAHERESWIWMRKRFIPYPFQNNVHRLPPEDRDACVQGLLEAASRQERPVPAHFEEWMRLTLGHGITDVFMKPYNTKVWAYAPDRLAWNWIGERVAVPDYAKLLATIREGRDDISWGPNRTFTFPKHGGTGSIWNAVGRGLPPVRVSLGCRVVRIDTAERIVHTADGQPFRYRYLISTLPLNRLLELAPDAGDSTAASRLMYSAVHVIGVGVDGDMPDALRTKCWMYFPESNSPYYRVTVFSNYSPFNVAQPGRQWSLMAEISESPQKRVDVPSLLEDTIRAMQEDDLLPDRRRICTTVVRHLPQAYPTPFLGRDSRVDPILRRFEEAGVFSRGRFGAWKYEVGNEDHSFSQGRECADRLLREGGKECEPTLFTPSLVNSRRNP